LHFEPPDLTLIAPTWKLCPQGAKTRDRPHWSWPACPALCPLPSPPRLRGGAGTDDACSPATVSPARRQDAWEQAAGNEGRCSRSSRPHACSHLPNFCHLACYLDADCRLRSRACAVKGLTKRRPAVLNAAFHGDGALPVAP